MSTFAFIFVPVFSLRKTADISYRVFVVRRMRLNTVYQSVSDRIMAFSYYFMGEFRCNWQLIFISARKI